jgi:hypothetical protein
MTNRIMKQSPSWKTYIYSAIQEIFPHFMESEISLTFSKELAIGPYPEPDASSPHLPTLFP